MLTVHTLGLPAKLPAPSFPRSLPAEQHALAECAHANHRALEVTGPLLARNAAEEAEDSEAEERMHVDL
jgi:hypothetical protein